MNNEKLKDEKLKVVNLLTAEPQNCKTFTLYKDNKSPKFATGQLSYPALIL